MNNPEFNMIIIDKIIESTAASSLERERITMRRSTIITYRAICTISAFPMDLTIRTCSAISSISAETAACLTTTVSIYQSIKIDQIFIKMINFISDNIINSNINNNNAFVFGGKRKKRQNVRLHFKI